MSNRLSIIQGTTKTVAIDLVDSDGETIPLDRLKNASAAFLLRVQPTDVLNILRYTTTDNPGSLSFSPFASVLNLTFQSMDTGAIPLGTYFYQVQITLTDGTVSDAPPWTPVDIVLGGSASPAPPVFDNTVKITADYPNPGVMRYVTAGGSPIPDAQIRVYLKADLVAGNLDRAIGITQTDANGEWVQPILVTPGYLYAARFEKPYEFGPDVVEFFA